MNVVAPSHGACGRKQEIICDGIAHHYSGTFVTLQQSIFFAAQHCRMCWLRLTCLGGEPTASGELQLLKPGGSCYRKEKWVLSHQ